MQDLDQRYAALVFDLDGTLADTMPTHFAAWSETLERHGLKFPEDRFYALGGVPAPTIVKMLGEEQGVEADGEAVAHEKELRFEKRVACTLRPVDRVLAIARDHRDRMPMAVATGSPAWLAGRILRALGIEDWFGAVVGADEVERPKPAPDTYAEAARRLGVVKERCLAFEDTAPGLESARAAGMEAVDIRGI